MRNVTVVIPVYGDWSSIAECISSLKQYLPQQHNVLIVNDMGPEWESLERNILDSIKGISNFGYFKNKENIGFVKTCNRAVLELDNTENDIFLLNSDTKVTEGFMDEMLEVLYSAEKHGIVCPRSNNATFLSIPYHIENRDEFTDEDSYKAFLKLRDILPRYEILPTGVGFAFLIKRKLITEYGLFDEVYSPGYNEENDFCQRVNEYGFNTIMANRAYVFHYESKSFGALKHRLDAEHVLILEKRYPYYWDSVQMYFDYEISAANHFGDLIADVYPKKKVLISLYEMPAAHNGTAEHGLSFLRIFHELFGEKYDISILIGMEADSFHHVSENYQNVYYAHTLVGTYHIAYVPSQIYRIEHMHILNRSCLKYVFAMQDIISVRSRYLLVNDWEREIVFRKSIEYSDGIAFISQFALDDTRAYYPDCFKKRDVYTRVIRKRDDKDDGEDASRAVEIEQILRDVLELPLNIDVLNARWHDMKYMERVNRCYLPSGKVQKERLRTRVKKGVARLLKKNPRLFLLAKRIWDRYKGR